MGSEGCRVEVLSKERVAPVLPLHEHWLPLSNLDLLLPPLDFGVFLCYKNNSNDSTEFAAVVSSLKASLAQALVTYYPFAGEVVPSSAGEPELLCNNRGVDFIVARSVRAALEDLNLHDPDESVEGKLVPRKTEGVLCVQATELRCGGTVLACSFDHRVADAYSANMFLVAWSEISRRKPLSVSPSFRKSILSPRRPRCVDSSLDRLYVPISSLKMKKPVASDETAINRIYYIAEADVERMQAEASGGSGRRSKLEAFSAYLWKLIGRGAVKREVEGYKVCRMGVVVNGRSRLNGVSEAMDRYFGNVLTIPYGVLDLKDIEETKLADVADAVHAFVREVATEEHFLSLIDWVEAHRPEPAATRIYFNEEEDGVNFVVSSGRDFPVAEVEFGWGRPAFGSYHFPWGGSAGYVMPMPSAKGNGDWLVYMHLNKDLMEVIEAEAGEVFRPITVQYVMNDQS